MNICVISDTHGLHNKLQIPNEIDTIIHCGDFTSFKRGNKEETINFLNWFDSLPIKNKILIAGNHEYFIERLFKEKHLDNFFKENYPNINYLQDSSIVIDGIKFYGSPWTLTYQDFAFGKTEEKLLNIFNEIDVDTNVLITHTPPYSILDLYDNKHLGSESLLKALDNLKNLNYHVFGHIHDSNGIKEINKVKFINSSFVSYSKLNNLNIFNIYIFLGKI